MTIMSLNTLATLNDTPSSSKCLLDSGTSHHVIVGLANISLHQPYDGMMTSSLGMTLVFPFPILVQLFSSYPHTNLF